MTTGANLENSQFLAGRDQNPIHVRQSREIIGTCMTKRWAEIRSNDSAIRCRQARLDPWLILQPLCRRRSFFCEVGSEQFYAEQIRSSVRESAERSACDTDQPKPGRIRLKTHSPQRIESTSSRFKLTTRTGCCKAKQAFDGRCGLPADQTQTKPLNLLLTVQPWESQCHLDFAAN